MNIRETLEARWRYWEKEYGHACLAGDKERAINASNRQHEVLQQLNTLDIKQKAMSMVKIKAAIAAELPMLIGNELNALAEIHFKSIRGDGRRPVLAARITGGFRAILQLEQKQLIISYMLDRKGSFKEVDRLAHFLKDTPYGVKPFVFYVAPNTTALEIK